VTRLHELGELRAGRRGEDVKPGVVAERVRAHDLRLAKPRLVPDELGERLAHLDVQVRRDLAELDVGVDEDHSVGTAARLDDRDVRRDGRRPHAALRAEDGHGPVAACR
jgi:hypothetical protein